MKNPRLFIGPMSKEIVDIAIEYSEKKNCLGFIPSRRQVEHDGGYVNKWTTKEFANYVKVRSATTVLVRDHGGPGQGSSRDDGKISLSNDVSSGFDIIHIDPWKECSSIAEGVKKTQELIEHCMSQNPTVRFEVGTEESIFPYTPNDLDKILTELKAGLGKHFQNIKYAVIQSGVKISGTNNVGNFDAERLKQMIAVVKKHRLLSKEHNGDYLTYEQIRTRAQLGLDSINIAPEFGVRQTRIMVNSGMDFSKALETCKNAKKYEKWIPDEDKASPSDTMIVEVSGHYSFTEQPFLEQCPKIKGALRTQLFDRFDEIYSAWSGVT